MIIPLRDVNTVEKTDNPAGGEYTNALVVTTKGRVSNESRLNSLQARL